MHRISVFFWLVAVLSWSASSGARPLSDEDCQQLRQQALPGVEITQAQRTVGAQAKLDPSSALTGASGGAIDLPAHCLVRGMIGRHQGPDGKTYGIRFELRMPDDWHGRFLFQGGGGLDGFLGQALGSVPSHGSTATPALMRGYAVVSMDGGHEGRDASFAVDQQARLDYAYAAIGKVTQQARSLVQTYYGSPVQHAYFMGCSNGGREAMLAAQRYPLEFDGVVAGNPGFRLSRAAIGEVWDTRILLEIAPRDAQGRPILAQALTPEDLALVSKGVLQACDALDGIEDGLINDHAGCRFDPATLQCGEGQSDGCLEADKVAALGKIFTGARNSRGEALYTGWPYDAGIGAPGWRTWKLGFSEDAGHPDALSVMLGMDSLFRFYMIPPRGDGTPMSFDFDRDPALLEEVGALNDAVLTDLSTYEARGGRMLIFQGLSDPVFSATDIQRWYQATIANTSGGDLQRQRAWARLFLVPGMTHCGDGPALDDFDPLTAIEAWVEQQQPPEYLEATGKAFPGRHQPICAWPQTAHYRAGDPDQLASYQCQ